jgi:hypothetical protein
METLKQEPKLSLSVDKKCLVETTTRTISKDRLLDELEMLQKDAERTNARIAKIQEQLDMFVEVKPIEEKPIEDIKPVEEVIK